MTQRRSADTKSKTLRDRVAAALDKIRPLVQADGGDVELVGMDDEGVVTVRLRGACIGCPSAAITLTLGIERSLMQEIPEVTRVVSA